MNERTPSGGVPDVVFLVVERDKLGIEVHAAYRHGGDADVHAKCVGAAVMVVQLLERVPRSVIDRCIDDFGDEPLTMANLRLDDLKAR